MATKGDISGLDILQFGGKPLIPLISSFSGSRRTGVIQSDVPGGANRQRKKFYNTTYLYTASFYLESPQQQDYVKFFFNRNEGKKFICHLAADRPLVEPYVVQAVTEITDVYRNAHDGEISMTLEVYSTYDQGLDELMSALYGCSGEDASKVISELDELVWMILQ